MQKPWGIIVLDLFEEKQGGQCIQKKPAKGSVLGDEIKMQKDQHFRGPGQQLQGLQFLPWLMYKIIRVEGWGNLVNIWEGSLWLLCGEKSGVCEGSVWKGGHLSGQGILLKLNIDQKHGRDRKSCHKLNTCGIKCQLQGTSLSPFHAGYLISFRKFKVFLWVSNSNCI